MPDTGSPCCWKSCTFECLLSPSNDLCSILPQTCFGDVRGARTLDEGSNAAADAEGLPHRRPRALPRRGLESSLPPHPAFGHLLPGGEKADRNSPSRETSFISQRQQELTLRGARPPAKSGRVEMVRDNDYLRQAAKSSGVGCPQYSRMSSRRPWKGFEVS